MVSGLPASGKTTLALELARAFNLPFLDKDDILEALFDALEIGDLASRQRLSRASDDVLIKLAGRSRGAVLISFWRHPGVAGSSGTPTDWIAGLPGQVVEVHCHCPAEVALARFRGRVRHPGHNDAARTGEALAEQFRLIAARGPLGLGRLVTVDTSRALDLEALVGRVRAALGEAAPT